MIYAYDNAVQLPVRDLYDTQMMSMAIAAARNAYEMGQQEIRDFKKEYGDFITPIQADQDWYNQNVTGRIRDAINQMYDSGIDPVRSAEGRAAISSLINSIDVGSIAKLKSSAQNANEFLKARRVLEAQGLYNPAIAKYDGPDISTYHTLDQDDSVGMGIWDKMSPTPYQNMSDFTKSYFDNIAPFQRSSTKNGISYTVSEINPQDLYDIAEAHYNDLVNTPQGQLMYKMYKDQLGSDEAAKKAFNDAVVSGNLDRLRYSDNYDERVYQTENLNLKRQALALRRQIQQAKLRGDSGGPGTELQGISLAQTWYDKAMSNAYSANGYTVDWDQMHNYYGDFSRDASKIFHDFGDKFRNDKINPTNQELLSTATRDTDRKSLQGALDTPKDRRNSGQNGVIAVAVNKWKEQNKPNLQNIRDAYKKQFSIAMDGKSVAEIIGTPLSDNKMVATIGDGAINKIFGEDDIISNTSGYTKAHTSKDTQRIRAAIKKYGAKNTTITSMERGYGSLRKNTGSFEINPEIKIVCTDDNGKVQFTAYGYYDIGLGSNPVKGGSYLGNYKSSGGADDLGNMTGTNPTAFKIGYDSHNGPIEIGTQRHPGLVYTPQYGPQTNMFPDYNRWNEFGVWDTDVTAKRLHAGQSQKLGTYGDPYATYDEDYLDDIIYNN